MILFCVLSYLYLHFCWRSCVNNDDIKWFLVLFSIIKICITLYFTLHYINSEQVYFPEMLSYISQLFF